MTSPSVERSYDEARQVVQEWVDKQGHERCWYYPEIFRRLCQVLGVVPSKDPALPPLEEFKKGCEQYQTEEYARSSHQSYTSGSGSMSQHVS